MRDAAGEERGKSEQMNKGEEKERKRKTENGMEERMVGEKQDLAS